MTEEEEQEEEEQEDENKRIRPRERARGQKSVRRGYNILGNNKRDPRFIRWSKVP